MLAPVLVTFTLLILAPVMTSILRFLKARASSALQSASSSGRTVGATSMSDTLVPKLANTSANSQPTAPAPMTAMVAGAFSATSTSSLESTTCLSSSRPICGSPFTREPVAMTTAFFASCVSFLPSAPVTVTFLPFSITPSPRIHCTLCFLNRNSTPLEFCWLTDRERFMAGPKSSVTPSMVMP